MKDFALYSKGSGQSGKDDTQRSDRSCDVERSRSGKCGLRVERNGDED